uniref:Dual oxidase maturation factor 1 n=2 Tax=Caenorhabditis japonica TaxID=281687 RepID=A0A8R1DEY9_CAEJA
MAEALRHGLEHGLPYPMLSVLEYFSLNQDAFDWGRHYRVAGHYTYAAVWFAFACWCLSILLLLLLPHYAYKSILATGISCLVACLVYLLLSPCELRIAFTGEDLERVDLTATFSFCFYLIFAVGLLCVICGLGLGICEHWRIYSLSTFLDASLDEHVGSKWKKLPTGGPGLQGVQIGAYATNTADSGRDNKSDYNSDKTAASSGFQSRTSTCQSSASSASLRSQTSFETVHDEQELDRTHVHFSQDPCTSSS